MSKKVTVDGVSYTVPDDATLDEVGEIAKHGDAAPKPPSDVAHSEPVGRFMSNFADAVNPLPGLSEMATEATDPKIGLAKTLGSHILQPQADQLKEAKANLQDTSAPLAPRLFNAGVHAAGGLTPLIGPPAVRAGEQIGRGDVAGGLGSSAGLLTGLAAPEIMKLPGRGLQRAAEPLAENAMGIRNVDRKFGRQPGRAILDETTGVRPSTVAESAGNKIGDLSSQRDAYLTSSPVKINLDPAIMKGKQSIAKAAAGNSDVGHLEPLISQLTEPKPGFAGATIQPPTPMVPQQSPVLGPNGQPVTRMIPGTPPPAAVSPLQSPMDALGMRQRFANDFTKFDAARPLSKESLNVGNQMYGDMTDAIHRGVPESAPLDKRISNLIPARDGGNVQELKPSLNQRIMQRFGVHTGALAGAALGAHEFGLPGAVAGLAIPELLADPTAQMVAARGLNAGGKALQSPVTGATAATGTLLKPRKQSAQ